MPRLLQPTRTNSRYPLPQGIVKCVAKRANKFRNVFLSEEGESSRIIRPEGSNSDAKGLAFNSIRKIKRTLGAGRRVGGRTIWFQPAVKHMRRRAVPVDNFVIIFYFLDHFPLYLFESIFLPHTLSLPCGRSVFWCYGSDVRCVFA